MIPPEPRAIIVTKNFLIHGPRWEERKTAPVSHRAALTESADYDTIERDTGRLVFFAN